MSNGATVTELKRPTELERLQEEGIRYPSDYKWIVRLEVVDEGGMPCNVRGVRALLVNNEYAEVFAGEGPYTGGNFDLLQEMCDAWNEKHKKRTPTPLEIAVTDQSKLNAMRPILAKIAEQEKQAASHADESSQAAGMLRPLIKELTEAGYGTTNLLNTEENQ